MDVRLVRDGGGCCGGVGRGHCGGRRGGRRGCGRGYCSDVMRLMRRLWWRLMRQAADAVADEGG